MQDIQGLATDNCEKRSRTWNESVILPDGRKLGYSIFGKDDFKNVVIYFHGFPGSRLEADPSSRIAESLGMTVLAFDRPGIGSSDFLSYASFSQFAKDIEAALDMLSVRRAALLCVSGGTPYGLATALHLPDKISKAAVVSGIGDFARLPDLSGMNFGNRAFISAARRCHPLGVLFAKGMAKVWREVPLVTALWFGSVLPKEDLEIMKRPAIGLALARGMKEALKPGVRGVVGEFSRMMKPWDLELENIVTPLKIWHGEKDTYVPTKMSSLLHKKVKNSELQLVPDGGHFMVFDRMEEILRWCSG